MKLEEISHGAYNFNVLRALIEDLEIIKIGTGVEVGVFDGGTSWYLLKHIPQLRLVSVDPYLAYTEYDQNRLNQAELTATKRLEQFGERSVRVKLPSVEAAKKIPAQSLDFVFLDGSHSGDDVRDDIAAWYPTVRQGGLFCGHDYRWPEVTAVVDAFVAENRLVAKCSPKESDIWWMIKP